MCLCNICNTSVCISKRNALSEVTACLRERLLRWQQIERLCGFPIFRNPGLANLTAQLYSESITLGLPRAHQPSWSCHSSVHGSIEDLLEEPSSPILPQMPGIPKEQSDLNYFLFFPTNVDPTTCEMYITMSSAYKDIFVLYHELFTVNCTLNY